MNTFRFRSWSVYKEAKSLFRCAIKIASKLPKEYKYSIGDQLVRAALSIILNIAEGSGKNSDKELNRYFDIAVGSVNEVFAVADTLKDVNLISNEEFENITKTYENISRQLGGFKKHVKSSIANRKS